MNFQQLEYIVAVDEMKSFTKAAARCFVTQATLSSMVKKLEDDLQLTLFDRKTSPIITTDCGQEILVKAREILFHREELRQISLSGAERIVGTLKIGIIPTIASSLLPLALESLLQTYPELTLSIVELTTDTLVNQVQSGLLDVGIVATPLHNTHLENTVLYYEPLYLYGTLGNQHEYVLPSDVSKERFWMLGEGHCLRNQFINVCKLNIQQLPDRLKFEANSFDTLLNMVDSLGGLTLLPELYAQNLPEARALKIRKLIAPQPVREVSLIYHRPFAKKILITLLEKEIPRLVQPRLSSSDFNEKDYQIALI